MCRIYHNLKLFVVERNSSLNKALTHFLSDKLGLDVIGTAQDYENLIRNKNLHCANLILLDTSLPSYKSYDAVNYIFHHNHRQNIIALTTEEKQMCLESIVLLGFKGAVLKNKMFDELETAIEKVVKGSMYFSPEIQNARNQSPFGYNLLGDSWLEQQ